MKKYILPLLIACTISTVSIGQVRIIDQFGNLKTVQAGQEPWNKAGTNTSSISNTDNIYQRGFVGSFPDLLSPITPNPSFNFDATQNVTGIANGLRLANNATAVAGNGMQINLDPVNQSTGNTTFIRSIYNGTGGANKSSALLIGNGNTAKTYLTLELGVNNTFEGNLGINTDQDATEKRPTQRLDVNGNARVRQLPNGTSDNTYTQTVISKNDGTLGYTNGTPLTTSKIINYVLTKATGIDRDWVQSYDTKIDATKYDVMILSIRFKGQNISSPNGALAFLNFANSVTVTGGTYRLSMDYASGTDNNSFPGAGTWDVVLAVMPKGQAVVITQSIQNTDAAAAAPAGL